MIKKIFFGIVTTGVRTVSGIIRNKIYAMVLSLNLYGILSIGIQSSGLLYIFIALGIPLGVTSLVSQIVDKSDEEKKTIISRIVVLASLVTTAFLFLLGLLLLIAPHIASRIVTAKDEYALPIAIVLLASPLMVFENALHSIMEGMGKLREIIVFKIVPVIIILPILYYLTTQYYLLGAALSVFVSEIVLCAVAVIVLRKFISLNRDAFRVQEIFRQIFKVAILSFTIGSLRLATDFIAKRYVLGTMGEIDNGIVQSVARITDLYPLLSIAWLSMHLFPALGTKRDDAAATARIVERATIIAVAIIIPAIVILFAFRTPILELMYKKEFSLATEYFGAMLATGIPKIYSWVLSVGLMAAGLRRQWFYSSIIMSGTYLCGVWVGFSLHFGIYALPLTTGIGFVLQSFYCLYAFKKNSVHFNPAFIMQSIIFGVFSLLFVASVFWNVLLVLITAGYIGFFFRYKLAHEIRDRLLGVFSKT